MDLVIKLKTILITRSDILNKLRLHILGLTCITIAFSFSEYFVDNYTPTKWIVVHLFSIILSILFLCDRKIKVPKIDGFNSVLIFSLMFFYLLSILINFNGSYISQYADWLSFVVILLTSYNCLETTQDVFLLSRYFLIAGLGITAYGLFQMFGIEFFPFVTHNEFPSSAFGFQNMTAEFMGIVIVFQIYTLIFNLNSRKKTKKIHLFFVSVMVAYLYILSSRASLLALLISCYFLIFRGEVFNKIKLMLKLLACTTAIILLLLGLQNVQYKKTKSAEYFTTEKTTNTNIRLIRWKNTLSMIAHNPLGVGPGNFEFGYIPYQKSFEQDPESTENLVVRSPHNGFLEAASENGLPFVTLLILYLCLCFFRLLKQKNVLVEDHNYFILAVFSFIVIVSQFSFPMEEAFPFYSAAVFLGLYFKKTSQKYLSIKGQVLLPGILFLSIFSISFAVSKFYEFTYFDNIERQITACRKMPENWRSCLQASALYSASGDLVKSTEILEGALTRQKYNFVALRMLSSNYLEQGRIDDACKILNRYLILYPNKEVQEEKENICSLN